MLTLDSLDWHQVRTHYDVRVKIHNQLTELLASSSASKFANLALDNEANYSAFENGLGGKILGTNTDAETKIFALAKDFEKLEDAHSVPKLIEDAEINFLKVGVGSELSCMVNPGVCWVANTRTIWSHLVVKHHGNLAAANMELSLYRDKDANSKMAYAKWAALHGEIDSSLRSLGELGSGLARRVGVTPGDLTYLWADAIATSFYAQHHSSRL